MSLANRYVELRARSVFSFLQSTIFPEELAQAAAASGYRAAGLVDAANTSGFVRFHKAAQQHGIKPLFGTELLVEGFPLAVLCETQTGYRNLCKLITQQHRTDRRRVTLFDLETYKEGLIALSGGAEGIIAKYLDANQFCFAERKLDTLSGVFGKEHFFVELQLHLDAQQDFRNAVLVDWANKRKLPLLLTNDVRMLGQDELLLLDTLTCIRGKVQLAAAGKRLWANGERFLKPERVMSGLLPDFPQAITNTWEIAERCTFSLTDLGYRFPRYPLPNGETPERFLRAVIFDAAPKRFIPYTPAVVAQLEREWELICKLGLCGYFLIVWDLIEFCKSRQILVQGRGSAANSAVCFALSITACDPLKMDLLFERFLSEERGEWPDIDLDLPSGKRREEVIQYLYRKYGSSGCALTATYNTYRARSAIRDVGKILGFSDETISQLAKKTGRFGDETAEHDSENPWVEQAKQIGLSKDDPTVGKWLKLVGEIQDLPRHIGQHPGGMVIAAGCLDEVIPIQPAAMPGRAIIQWDKDDCADMGIVKIDLLGLGMMQVLEEAGRLAPIHDGIPFDMASLPKEDPLVYSLIAQADTVGVFQVESRAQMSSLPRTRPRTFYDLVVQVGLIRPGPIVGKMVHPYMKRRAGQQPVSYPHPLLEPILKRTLGIPLFQEQVMRMAMIAAGFSGGLADQLRKAMDGYRNRKKMLALVEKLRIGMQQKGIPKESADQIEQAITAFAQYGFPESHAISFAWLTYASAYLKVHHPGIFYAALMNAWPMGFYSPATVVRDAQRRGVDIFPLSVESSFWDCSLLIGQTPIKQLRLGFRYVHGLRATSAETIVKARTERPFSDLSDFMKRCPALSKEEVLRLAELNALSTLGVGSKEKQAASIVEHAKADTRDRQTIDRRSALWQVSQWEKQNTLPIQNEAADERSPLSPMTAQEELQTDLQGSGLSVHSHPIELIRPKLEPLSVMRIAELCAKQVGHLVQVAGICIIRQRPPTAKGFLFLTLEDETGLLNVLVKPRVAEAHRAMIYGTRWLFISGVIEQNGEGIQLKANRVGRLVPSPSELDRFN